MRNRLWTAASITSVTLILGSLGGHASAQSQQSKARELLGQYCYSCHSQKVKAGGLVLERVDPDHVAGGAAVWEKVVRKLHSGMMPPPGLPQPPKASRDGLVTNLETSLDKAAAEAPNPGRVETFHRLNRTEYQNAVRDLLDLDIDAASMLPVDDVSHGFDNMAGLRISTVLMERYITAARKISRLAVGDMKTTPAEDESEFPVSSGKTSASPICLSEREAGPFTATRSRWMQSTPSKSN